jgi:hypothetical protein
MSARNVRLIRIAELAAERGDSNRALEILVHIFDDSTLSIGGGVWQRAKLLLDSLQGARDNFLFKKRAPQAPDPRRGILEAAAAEQGGALKKLSGMFGEGMACIPSSPETKARTFMGVVRHMGGTTSAPRRRGAWTEIHFKVAPRSN